MSGTVSSTPILVSLSQSVSLLSHTTPDTVAIDMFSAAHADISGLRAGDTLTLLNLVSPLDYTFIPGDGTITTSLGGTVLLDGIAFSQIEDTNGLTTNWRSGTTTISGVAYNTESVVIGALSIFADMTDAGNRPVALLAANTVAGLPPLPGAPAKPAAMTEISAPVSLPDISTPPPAAWTVPGGYVVGLGLGNAMQVANGTLTFFSGTGSLAIDYTPGAYANMVIGGAQGLAVEAGQGAGHTTVVGGSGGVTVHGGVGGDHKLVVGGGGALSYTAGAGEDTIFAGAASSVTVNGAGHCTVVGGPLALDLQVPAGYRVFVGAGGGDLTAQAAGVTLLGGANAQLHSAAAGGDLLVGNGALLDASSSSGGNSLFAQGASTVLLGSGADTVVALGGTVQAGSGSAFVFLGGGAGETIDIGPSGNAGRNIELVNFQAGLDHLALTGGATATQVQDWGGGLTQITLSDGSNLNVFGVDTNSLASLA